MCVCMNLLTSGVSGKCGEGGCPAGNAIGMLCGVQANYNRRFEKHLAIMKNAEAADKKKQEERQKQTMATLHAKAAASAKAAQQAEFQAAAAMKKDRADANAKDLKEHNARKLEIQSWFSGTEGKQKAFLAQERRDKAAALERQMKITSAPTAAPTKSMWQKVGRSLALWRRRG